MCQKVELYSGWGRENFILSLLLVFMLRLINFRNFLAFDEMFMWKKTFKTIIKGKTKVCTINGNAQCYVMCRERLLVFLQVIFNT